MATDLFTPIKLGGIELNNQRTFYGGSEKGYTDYPTL
jgi:hypothetical protein